MAISIVSFEQVNDWDSFVEAHPRGTIFHTRAMVETLSATKFHQPLAIGAIDENGELCALLAAVKVQTLGGWFDSFTARSIQFVEPIWRLDQAGLAGARQLIQRHDQIFQGRTLFAEVRSFFAAPDAADDPFLTEGYSYLGYRNILNDLRFTEEELFAKLDKKCRNNVRSSVKHGVCIEEVEPLANVELFYQLVAESYAHARVPLSDISLFDNAFRKLPPKTCRVLIAKYQGDVVAAGCFLTYKERVYAWYVGTQRIPGVYPMVCLFWDAIKRFALEGYATFDFAGAGWEGEDYGPGRFKAKFGGQVLNYGRYRKVFSPAKLRYSETAYGLVRGWMAPKQ
jgi:serine/alanine adding enzyme